MRLFPVVLAGSAVDDGGRFACAVLVILQFFPRFTNVSPGLAALPLIVVLAITAIKDAYEDFKRHQSDRSINNQKVYVLTGGGFHNSCARLISRS